MKHSCLWITVTAFLYGSYLLSANSNPDRSFNREKFFGHESCGNFFDALEHMQEIRGEGANYLIQGNCILVKRVLGNSKSNILICPHSILERKQSTDFGELSLTEIKHSPENWKKLVPCRAYQDYKRPKV